MTWKHRRSPAKKKFKIVQSTAKVTAALSWDVYVVLWVVCIPVGSITTAAAYQEILKNVEETNRQRTPGCCPKEVFCTTMPDQRVMPQLQTSWPPGAWKFFHIHYTVLIFTVELPHFPKDGKARQWLALLLQQRCSKWSQEMVTCPGRIFPLKNLTNWNMAKISV